MTHPLPRRGVIVCLLALLAGCAPRHSHQIQDQEQNRQLQDLDKRVRLIEEHIGPDTMEAAAAQRNLDKALKEMRDAEDAFRKSMIPLMRGKP